MSLLLTLDSGPVLRSAAQASETLMLFALVAVTVLISR